MNRCKMNRSAIRETLGAGIIAGPSGADTWLPILPVEKQGTLVTTAHKRLSTSAVRVLPAGGREEYFSLVGDSGQKPGRALGGT